MIKLIYEDEMNDKWKEISPSIEIALPGDGHSLSQVLEAVDCFIKAMDYHPKGELEYVEDESIADEPE